MNPVVKAANQVQLKEVTNSGKSFLQFDFIGYLDHPTAVKAIEEWKDFMKTGKKINVIYNCTEMNGFDTPARKEWQNTMAQFKQQIGNIWIISTNSFILAAAKTMGILSGYDIKVSKSINNINF